MTKLRIALPVEWEIAEAVSREVPAWSRRGLACTKIVLIGPQKTGYRYYDKAGNLIAEHFSMREAISVWVAESGIDMGWSLSDSLRNRLSKIPIARPVLLHAEGEQVFGLEELFLMDTTYTKKSPQGTVSARAIRYTRSWPEWRRDIGVALQAVKKKPNKAPEPTATAARDGRN